MAVGEYADRAERRRTLAGQRVEFVDCLHLVVPERQPPGAVLQMGGKNLDAVAPDPEGAPVEIVVVAPVLEFDEALEEMVPVQPLARRRHRRHLGIVSTAPMP